MMMAGSDAEAKARGEEKASRKHSSQSGVRRMAMLMPRLLILALPQALQASMEEDTPTPQSNINIASVPKSGQAGMNNAHVPHVSASRVRIIRVHLVEIFLGYHCKHTCAIHMQ